MADIAREIKQEIQERIKRGKGAELSKQLVW
jgi:hypothetical protein